MPGITGIIANRPPDAAMLQTMVKSMMHEPFYVTGAFSNDSLGTGVGWAGHAGSFSGTLPVWNEAKNIGLVFIGENFARQSDLGNNGHPQNSGDARWMIHLYEEFGAGFLEKLNGWFSGVLVDLREKKTILFNDRYGLSRIYLHENAEGTCFASEAKALLRVLPQLRRLDAASLAEFASCGCVLQNRTLFSGVALLPPASRWVFSPGQPVRKEIYFQKETWENQPRLSHEEFYEKLKSTFQRILPRYFGGEMPVGMSLTGGLDGRMIMAWAGREPGSLSCYTFGGTYRDCTDVALAQEVARCCEQPHRIVPVDGGFLGQFPALAQRAVHLSDGAMDVTGSVELYANQAAREIAPIRLTGNYGSEILRGNVAFKSQPLSPLLYNPDFARLGEAAAVTYAGEAQCHPLSFIAFKQVPWHHHSRLAVEQSQLTMRSPYLDNDLVAVAYQTPADLALSKTPALRLIADGNPQLARIPTDRGLLYQPTPVLTKLNHLYQEFTFRAEYAYDYGMPQWLARVDRAFAPLHLERIFLGRHKFYHFRVWYRDKLGAYLKDVLLDPRTKSRPYFQGTGLEELVTQHVSGARNYTSELHQALSIELIHRQLIEQN